MYIFTISISIATSVMSILVMTALRINKDNAEATSYIKKLLWVNLSALIMVLLTYSSCALALAMDGDAGTNEVYLTLFRFVNLADITLAPICITYVSYVSALVGHKPAVEMAVLLVRRSMMILGGMQYICVMLYLVLLLFGDQNDLMYGIAKNMTILVVTAFVMAITGVNIVARRYLGRERMICLSLYIVGSALAIWLQLTRHESLLFSMGAVIFIFLLLAMQNERVNMSNVESVKKALNQAEELNGRLEKSLSTIEREQFLLQELAEIYTSLHVINLKQGTYRQIGTVPFKVTRVIQSAFPIMDIQQMIWTVMRRVLADEYQTEGLAFTDFSTLDERMRGRKMITFEAIDDEDLWHRFSFIRIGSRLFNDLEEVVFASENIDQSKRENERLKRVSYIDELTGVFNRNAYIDYCRSFTNDAVPGDFWVMITDINGLKQVNDTKGHEAGDKLIMATADCLKRAVGTNGRIFRKGGDEFVSVVNADMETFHSIIENLSPAGEKRPDAYNGEVCFSNGYVCSGEMDGTDFDEMVREADRRMYENKKAFYRMHQNMDQREKYRQISV